MDGVDLFSGNRSRGQARSRGGPRWRGYFYPSYEKSRDLDTRTCCSLTVQQLDRPADAHDPQQEMPSMKVQPPDGSPFEQ